MNKQLIDRILDFLEDLDPDALEAISVTAFIILIVFGAPPVVYMVYLWWRYWFS